jgi:hypothetical protein
MSTPTPAPLHHTPGAFKPMPMSKFLAGSPPPLAWVWEPYLPVGSLSLLTAYAKVGKSTFAYPLALAIARGKPFLGTPTTQGPVLILAVEEHARDARLRLERFGATPTDPIHLHSGQLDPAVFLAVREFVRKEGVRLVLLDTLTTYWRIKDESDNAEIARLGSPFLDLAHETDAAVVLIHHHRKSGGADGHAIRGGGALFGLVDQALSLDKCPGAGSETHRVLKALGRYEDSPAEMILELDGDEYRAVGTPAQFTSEAREALMLGLLTDVPQTVEALGLKAKLGRSTAQRVLKRLGPKAARQGAGTKNDPYMYCRPFPASPPSPAAEPDSIPPSHPVIRDEVGQKGIGLIATGDSILPIALSVGWAEWAEWAALPLVPLPEVGEPMAA